MLLLQAWLILFNIVVMNICMVCNWEADVTGTGGRSESVCNVSIEIASLKTVIVAHISLILRLFYLIVSHYHCEMNDERTAQTEIQHSVVLEVIGDNCVAICH